MKFYIVLFKNNTLLPADPPLVFRCQAEDTEHAAEQCIDAYPLCDIVWMVETKDVDAAYSNYYGE